MQLSFLVCGCRLHVSFRVRHGGETFVILGITSMKFFGELFVWVSLNAQCFVDGEDFEEEWQLAFSVLLSDFVAKKGRIRFQDL